MRAVTRDKSPAHLEVIMDIEEKRKKVGELTDLFGKELNEFIYKRASELLRESGSLCSIDEFCTWTLGVQSAVFVSTMIQCGRSNDTAVGYFLNSFMNALKHLENKNNVD